MDQTWAETRIRLDSIRQEYLIITQELQTTSDLQRRTQLLGWASNCLHEFRYVLDQYEKHQRDQHPTTLNTKPVNTY